MIYTDFHTHHTSSSDTCALLQDRDSLGVHPWNITDPAASLETFRLHWQQNVDKVFAIGECGLDKVCDTPCEWQLIVFREMIRYSELYRLPLILHCVRSIDKVLALRRECKTIQPWIFHGFRGKPTQLNTLLDKGFYVSFGFHFNEESLLCCPFDRLLLESDDEPRPVSDLYAQVAHILHIPVEELCEQMTHNYIRLFGVR
uniref:Hydrolase TatD n=1 Tax=uncultured bacterium fosmid pJB135F11 TaxID=1478051 RepID=A0A0H3U8L8_9BACT|nr:hypothetical protein [uncultured bacterium fosmid pJB135F11]